MFRHTQHHGWQQRYGCRGGWGGGGGRHSPLGLPYRSPHCRREEPRHYRTGRGRSTPRAGHSSTRTNRIPVAVDRSSGAAARRRSRSSAEQGLLLASVQVSGCVYVYERQRVSVRHLQQQPFLSLPPSRPLSQPRSFLPSLPSALSPSISA